jgi:hypothetical protein
MLAIGLLGNCCLRLMMLSHWRRAKGIVAESGVAQEKESG